MFAIALAAAPALADTLEVTAEGIIQPSCGISAGSNFSAANLGADGSVAATASVNCNTPFRIRAGAANGALVNSLGARPSFVNTLNYDLTVTVPLDSGTQVTATCPSTSLVAASSACTLSPASASGLSSGGGTAIGKTATLSVQWQLAGARLLAGSYSDTITVTIAAQP